MPCYDVSGLPGGYCPVPVQGVGLECKGAHLGVGSVTELCLEGG